MQKREEMSEIYGKNTAGSFYVFGRGQLSCIKSVRQLTLENSILSDYVFLVVKVNLVESTHTHTHTFSLLHSSTYTHTLCYVHNTLAPSPSRTLSLPHTHT